MYKLIINKPIGVTCGEVVKRLKNNEFLANKIITFCGRLDPMASGDLIFLVTDKKSKEFNMMKNEYISLFKIYEYKFIVGFSTDTYDQLGFIKKFDTNFMNYNIDDLVIKISNVVSNYTGIQTQKYPIFSS